jgi:hypothetical protein
MVIFINSGKIEKMKLPKWIWLPFLLSVASFFLFAIQPATVNAQGFLQEPFFLILLGYGFLFFGVIVLIIQLIKQS